jgi:hypothetical protein
MNSRDKLHRKYIKTRNQDDRVSYAKQRNKVNVLVRKAKNSYFREKLNESGNKHDIFWKRIKETFPLKNKVNITKSFLMNGVLTQNKKTIAANFCMFFTNLAKEIKEKTIQMKDFVWHPPFVGKTKTYSTFHFKRVTIAEVHRHLKQLSRKKACGIDNLPPGYLKDVSDILAKPLCHLINICLRTGSVPNDFKIGKVSPILKSGSKHLVCFTGLFKNI